MLTGTVIGVRGEAVTGFVVVESSVPPHLTLQEYRRSRVGRSRHWPWRRA